MTGLCCISLWRVNSLGIFVVLGVGTGNFSSRKMTMEEYVHATNQKLSLLRTPTRVVDYHHMAGNFVVQTPKMNRLEIADELSLVLGTSCAVNPTQDVLACVNIAEKVSSPQNQPGIRWIKGIAFKVRGRSCTVDLKPSPRAEFFRIKEYAVGVFKKDQLIREGSLDKASSIGGWAAVSDDVSSATGGIWTARALMRIQGVVAKALKHEPTRQDRNQ